MSSSKFFDIPELLEMTLSLLSQAEILRLQSVSKQWKRTIKGSPALQRLLFLSPATIETVWLGYCTFLISENERAKLLARDDYRRCLLYLGASVAGDSEAARTHSWPIFKPAQANPLLLNLLPWGSYDEWSVNERAAWGAREDMSIDAGRLRALRHNPSAMKMLLTQPPVRGLAIEVEIDTPLTEEERKTLRGLAHLPPGREKHELRVQVVVAHKKAVRLKHIAMALRGLAARGSVKLVRLHLGERFADVNDAEVEVIRKRTIGWEESRTEGNRL